MIYQYIFFETLFTDELCRLTQSPANGSMALESSDAKVRNTTVATYSCNTGYNLVGNRERTCHQGVWMGTEPSCQGKAPEGILLNVKDTYLVQLANQW